MDLFGNIEKRPDFEDIRNQRESVAAEKARLCKELNEILRANPKRLASASINEVLAWKDNHANALKTLKSAKSSRSELQRCISSMGAYLAEKDADK